MNSPLRNDCFTDTDTFHRHSIQERSPNIKKILIVDDEKIFLLSLADGLNTFDRRFNILTAENGEKALKVLETEHVDLIVTDLKMPVMDGFEFLSHMRTRYPDIPVIVISAFINPDAERRLSSLGIAQYLEKPFNSEDLVDWIQKT